MAQRYIVTAFRSRAGHAPRRRRGVDDRAQQLAAIVPIASTADLEHQAEREALYALADVAASWFLRGGAPSPEGYAALQALDVEAPAAVRVFSAEQLAAVEASTSADLHRGG